MILFFSATGNCKYVAARLAQAADQEMLSIVDYIRENRYAFQDQTIGVISSTYDWGLPSIVKKLLEKASFQTDYLYFIATYGTTPGAAGYMASKAIRGCKINAYYAVRMPDTWTPIFDLSTPKKIAKYTQTTESAIDSVIRCIKARHTNRHMSPRTPAWITQLIAQPLFIITMYGEPPIFMWRIAALAADYAPKSARCRPLKCGIKSRSGSRISASCAWAACTAAPALQSSMAEGQPGMANI